MFKDHTGYQLEGGKDCFDSKEKKKGFWTGAVDRIYPTSVPSARHGT
jgi:hypothetical protein